MPDVIQFRLPQTPVRSPDVRQFLLSCHEVTGNPAVEETIDLLTDEMIEAWGTHELSPAEVVTVISAFSAIIASMVRDVSGIEKAALGRAMADIMLTRYTNLTADIATNSNLKATLDATKTQKSEIICLDVQ